MKAKKYTRKARNRAATKPMTTFVCDAPMPCDAGGPEEDGGHRFNSGPDLGNPECERCGFDVITWMLMRWRAA
jgi:hypothetical protein